MKIEEIMSQAFKLAKKGEGHTLPNPMVGAILVKNGKIIGRGYHQACGQNHAEIEAIENSTEDVTGSTLFSTLEPCCHLNKKTPPCAQRIIKEGIKEVIISSIDPNPLVQGKGIQLLSEAGISVKYGILDHEEKKLNEIYYRNINFKKPFIHLKWAQTIDGYIATKTQESKWITSEKMRKRVHELRGIHQGIGVGANTWKVDRPKLNIRYGLESKYQDPVVVLFGNANRILSSGNQFDEKRRYIIISSEKSTENNFSNIEIIHSPRKSDGSFNLEGILEKLYQKNICSLFIEGGNRTLGHFINQRQFQKCSIFMAPKLLGGGLKSFESNLLIKNMNEALSLCDVEYEIIDDQIILHGHL